MEKTEIPKNNDGRENSRREPRVHGGNVHEAAKRYDFSEDEFFDFSSNVNPLGPSASAVRAARRALSGIGRYPDPAQTGLRSALARYFGIKPAQVVCGNGASELIHLIPRVFRPKKVLVPVPTFSEYAAAVEGAGGTVVNLPLQERTGFHIDPLDMAFSLKGVDMAFLCNPNDPTGLLIPKAEMLEIAKYALENGVRLVIDEAYMDFVNAESMVKEAVQASRLICVRSFSTFFGIPGLRVGYAVSDEDTCAALRYGQEPWAVNAAGGPAAVAALKDWRHIKRTLRLVQKEREKLLSSLRMLPGVETFPASANFIFLKVTASNGPLLSEKLGLRKLLVRDCSSFESLDNRFLRIAVRTARENKRLIQALGELLNE